MEGGCHPIIKSVPIRLAVFENGGNTLFNGINDGIIFIGNISELNQTRKKIARQ